MRTKHYETKAQMRENIATCPYKNEQYMKCWSCETRADYLKKRTRYWAWARNHHDAMTTLSPAPECDTGR